MKTHYDALVVGAGVAGATAAILLARTGWSVAVLEKREFPRRKVCGECIAATNLDLLDALGVGETCAALAGPPLDRVALYVGEEELSADLPRLDGSRHPWGRALGREHLDTLLLRRAAVLGATVLQPWTVRQVARRGGTYLCSAAPSPGTAVTLDAPVLIAACGSWEPSPCAPPHRQPPPRPSDLFAFKATFDGVTLAPGLLPVLAFPGGYGGMVIADHGKLTLACCIRRDRLRQCRAARPGASAGAAVQALLEERCRGVRRALAGARREGAWLAVGPLRPGLRAPWHEHSGFAVGNAAGEAHPILGEGISMALQSAWLLCGRLNEHRDRLLRGADLAPVGRDYARQWRRHFAGRVRWAAVLAHLAMRPAAARGLLPILRRRPDMLTLCARLGGKVRSLADPPALAALRPHPGPAGSPPPRVLR
ncbi:MAG TPA: FAD-dependent oxidoreductase [Woeseiaceae bacterium]